MMRFKLSSLVLLLPLVLVGCGGGSSSGGGGNQPNPGVQAVTADGNQQANDIILTNGVKNSGVQLSAKALAKLQQDAHITPSIHITIEYYGDKPALPTTTGALTFGAFSDTACSNPQNKDDKCVTDTVTFNPTSVSEATSKSYFDGKLVFHAFVPFRMFTINNQTPVSVAGSPGIPNIQLQYTTQDPSGALTFNNSAAAIPTTATFTSPEVVIGSKPIDIPFELKKDPSNADYIDADYQYTVSSVLSSQAIYTSDFANLAPTFIKTYSKDTQLSYSTNNPEGGYDVGGVVPASITFTHSFVIATDKGNGYMLAQPTDSTSLYKLWASLVNKVELSDQKYMDGSAISSLLLPYRFNGIQDIMPSIILPETLDPTKKQFPLHAGQVTGSSIDKTLDTGADVSPTTTNAVARSNIHFAGTGDDPSPVNLTASLLPNADSNNFELVLHNMYNSETPKTTPPIDLTKNGVSIPKTLTNVKLAITTEDESNDMGTANILISGNNGTSIVNYWVVLSFSDVKYNPATLSSITALPNTVASPVVLTYQSFDQSKFISQEPEQTLVSFNPTNKQLSIQSANDMVKTTTIDFSSPSLGDLSKDQLVAMSCTDTDISQTPLTNTCYVLFNNPTAKTYAMYRVSNVDVNAYKAITPTITPLTLNISNTNTISKFVIDSTTGTVLTNNSSGALGLYVLNGTTYASPQTVSLPKDAKGASQVATNIYSY